jgi:hypothetical protein
MFEKVGVEEGEESVLPSGDPNIILEMGETRSCSFFVADP